MKFLLIISCLIIFCSKFYQIFGINTEGYEAVACSSGNNCDNLSNKEITTVNINENANYVTEFNDNNDWELNDNIYRSESIKTTSATPSTFQTITMPTSINESIIMNLTSKFNLIVRNNVEICTCDMTISECDINCCCDLDCTDFQLTIFSHCSDRKMKKYDSRYCYINNFIQRNNTQFILEQLTDNLFCIAYDNLPPKYSKSNAIKIYDRKQFDEILMKNVKEKFSWAKSEFVIPFNFNSSIPYRDNDIIWKMKENAIKLIDIPMSGFTGHCTFRNNLQYLKNFHSYCLQTKLSNDNMALFTEMYNNFTVISSPIFLNTTYLSSLFNQNCPKNICISIESKYCLDSSSHCNTVKPLKATCVNGTCKNIVRSVHYIIIHNGTMGIKRIQLNIELANVSQSFYQHFNVEYQWENNINNINIHYRSGNPGYLIGKPIIIGTLKPNTTDDVTIGHTNSNNANFYLTVPLARKNSDCNEKSRYIVKFGEDLKSKCRTTLMTNNFSINSCIQLHENILTIFFEQSLVNVTEIENYKIYVSKLGNVTNNNISDWNQILINKVPNKFLKDYENSEKIRCSGLITSLTIDILYSLLSKPDNIDNYKIVGIGMTTREVDYIDWPRCVSLNCTESLNVDLITYVKFHDISTPESSYYVGGPNLDISLPYNFFYPFLNGSSTHCKMNLFIIIVVIAMIFIYI